MKRFFANMNPTVRGFLLIGLVALAVVLLSLEESLFAISMLLRIAFFLAIAFFLFLLWRERRGDIESWGSRAQWVFYGAVGLALVDIALFVLVGAPGRTAFAFVVVLILCAFSIWRVWRDEHTYS